MMPREAIAAAVVGAISRVMEIPSTAIAEDARLADDLGADSIALVQIADLVEDACDAHGGPALRFDDAELAALPTVGSAIDYLARQGAP